MHLRMVANRARKSTKWRHGICWLYITPQDDEDLELQEMLAKSFGDDTPSVVDSAPWLRFLRRAFCVRGGAPTQVCSEEDRSEGRTCANEASELWPPGPPEDPTRAFACGHSFPCEEEQEATISVRSNTGHQADVPQRQEGEG